MIEDIKLIERMDKLLEVGEDPEFTAEQNLSLVMGALEVSKTTLREELRNSKKNTHQRRMLNVSCSLFKRLLES